MVVQKNGVARINNIVSGPPMQKEVQNEGLGSFLYEQFKENGNAIFQVHAITGETETYGSVLQRSIRAALEMKRRGVTQEDVIALCSENSMDAFVPIFATQLLNAKIACFDASLSLRDTVRLLELVKPKIVFVGHTGSDLMNASLGVSTHKFEIVTMDDSSNNPFKEFRKEHPDENTFQPKPVSNVNATAVILFSSGTTGMPKGICCSGNALIQTSLAAVEFGLSCKVGLHTASFYWISAFMITLMTIIEKGYKVILPKYEVRALFEAIEKWKVSFLFISTSSLNDFTDEIMTTYDLRSIENFTFGGSIANEETIVRWRKYFKEATFVSSYGQTEACGFITTFSRNTIDLTRRHVTSVGQPLPGMSIKIVDPETDEVLGVNETGEIRVSSKYQFVGYYNADCSDVFDKDGFVKSGDIGYMNEDNCLFVCDRIKDMIKYRDWHVVPASVEKIIYQHPAVLEAVLLGIPHPQDGDHPLACVVLREGFRDTKEEEILNFVNDRVLDREKLRAGVMFLDQLPKTPSGKVIRRNIKQAILEKKITRVL